VSAADRAEVVGEQLAFELPGLSLVACAPARKRHSDPRRPGAAARAAVPPVPRVWGVWDGEDLVGVYAEEQVARADVAVLRRDAVRAGVRASMIDCLPVPVLTATQHRGREAEGSPGGRWR